MPERSGSGAYTTHAELDALLAKVRELWSGGDQQVVLEAWRVFEHEVRLHLAQEESLLVPAFSRAEPRVADTIEIEHDVIRDAMRACRHALEKGEMDPRWLSAVIDHYRGHQLHEESTMYAWARA